MSPASRVGVKAVRGVKAVKVKAVKVKAVKVKAKRAMPKAAKAANTGGEIFDCQLCPRAFGRSTTRIDWDLHSYLPKWQSAKSKYCSQSYSARSCPPRRMW